jgi:putative ABC transport system permease protein
VAGHAGGGCRERGVRILQRILHPPEEVLALADRLRRSLLLGVRSLTLHKLRSTLTAMGIIFGVSSVIAMLSIGEGASWEAQEEIKKLGSQNIILKSEKPKEEEQSGARSEVVEYGLTREDYTRVSQTIPGVKVLIPLRIARADAQHRSSRTDIQVVGTEPGYLEVGNARVARGRFLASGDLSALRNVCVLGSQVARTLFPIEDPIYQKVKVGSDFYQVVGVMKETGAASGTGSVDVDDRNKDVYIPLSTFDRRFGETLVHVLSGGRHMERVEIHQIIVTLESDTMVMSAARAVRSLLDRFHDSADYEVVVPLELLIQKERTKRIFNVVLGSIAAISLLVGGIGIMNIMLATITERTREIGIRRALGAKRRDITTQFLIETVVLSTSGGLLGMGLGTAIPFAVEATSGMKTIVTPYSLAVSFGISVAVGVIFGLYPARRAALMDPIEALRRE